MKRVYSFGFLPDLTRGRREVRELTGQSYVPVLVLDNGETIADSDHIVAWAKDNPAGGAS